MSTVKNRMKRKMRRMACLVCAVYLLTGFSEYGAWATDKPTYGRYGMVEVTEGTVVSTVEVNLRRGPGTNYGILGVLQPGDTCTIKGEEGDWYLVVFNEKEGYVSKEFLSVRTYETEEPTEIGQGALPEGYEWREITIGKVISDVEINVRKGPGKKYEAFVQMAPGDRCTVLEDTEENGEWIHIEYDGQDGYAAREYIEITVEIQAVPVSQATPEPTGEPETTKDAEPTATPNSDGAIATARPGYEMQEVMVATVTTEIETNVRSGAGTNYDVIAQLNPGEKRQVLGEENGWYCVRMDDQEGYVSKDLVVISTEMMEIPMTTEEPSVALTNQPVRTELPDAEEGYEWQEITTGTVASEKNINVRKSPDADDATVLQMAPGDKCRVLSEEEGWYFIRFGEIEGYAEKEYISVTTETVQVSLEETVSPTIDASREPQDTPLPDLMEGYEWQEVIEGTLIAEQKTNVRMGPGTSYDIIDRMEPGEKCRVLTVDDDWCRVEFDGQKGYVSRELLELTSYMEQVEVIVEDPLEAKVVSFSMPHVMLRKETITVQGIVKSNIPITSVTVSVYDVRSGEEVMTVSRDFVWDEGIREFDLNDLDGDLPFRKLAAGEKELKVIVGSSSEEQVALEEDFAVLGEYASLSGIEEECTIVSEVGRAGNVDDDDYDTVWQPETAGDSLEVTLPEGRTSEMITLEWTGVPSAFEVEMDGKIFQETNEGDMISFAYETNGASRIVIRVSDANAALCEVTVYEQGKTSELIQNWQPLSNQVDMMVIVAHPGDEFYFFGSAIPQAVAEGKEVAVVYMTDCGRERTAEALNALWTAGVKTHPIFLNMKNGTPKEYEDAIEMWGLEETYETLVEVLRRYKPEVVLTHDIEGEDGDNQHKLTSAALRRAVLLATDEETYPDSAAEYGVWDVPKTYIHRYEGNVITLNADVVLESLNGWTCREVMKAAYYRYESLTKRLKLDEAEEYTPDSYGLIRTVVGDDTLKNSFFENLD